MIIDNSGIEAVLTHGTEELGISLPCGAPGAFGIYFEFLEKCGRNFNLTAITGEDDVLRLHFLDSLAMLKFCDFKDMTVMDVGSGAGFPGLPLKLAEPSMELTLLDATKKRVLFLSELCKLLEVKTACVHARAEEAAHWGPLRESYDIVLSRAVARLNILCELCLPFVCPGGRFIAMKGSGSEGEIIEAGGAIGVLGAELQECVDYSIPGTDIKHRAVIIRKISKTPEKYPRRFAKIQKCRL